MSRPRFLADNDLRDPIVDGVLRREPTVELTPLRDFGLEAASDPEVLAFAAREGLIVVSHDVNSMSAHAYDRIRAGEPMTGLILAHQTEPIAAVIDSLVLIWAATEADQWLGRVEYVPM